MGGLAVCYATIDDLVLSGARINGDLDLSNSTFLQISLRKTRVIKTLDLRDTVIERCTAAGLVVKDYAINEGTNIPETLVHALEPYSRKY